MIITATKTMEFCAGHRLLNYDGPCSRPHGHNYRAEVEVGHIGEDVLTKEGFILDFTVLKKAIKDAVDVWDHRMVLQMGDPLVEHLSEAECHVCPIAPTAENMARILMRTLKTTLYGIDKELVVMRVKLWETSTSYAEVVPGADEDD